MPFSASQEETSGELRGTLDKKVRGYIVTFGLRVSASERAGYSVSGAFEVDVVYLGLDDTAFFV